MAQVINDIINPAIFFCWKAFSDVIGAISGASTFILYTIFIYMVFRFMLAPVLRINLGRIQNEIAGSDKTKKNVDKYDRKKNPKNPKNKEKK